MTRFEAANICALFRALPDVQAVSIPQLVSAAPDTEFF